MKCKHYKGDGYTYIIGKQELNLCEQCEMDLLEQMKRQEVIENKMQRLCNVNFEVMIDKINGKLNDLTFKIEDLKTQR